MTKIARLALAVLLGISCRGRAPVMAPSPAPAPVLAGDEAGQAFRDGRLRDVLDDAERAAAESDADAFLLYFGALAAAELGVSTESRLWQVATKRLREQVGARPQAVLPPLCQGGRSRGGPLVFPPRQSLREDVRKFQNGLLVLPCLGEVYVWSRPSSKGWRFTTGQVKTPAFEVDPGERWLLAWPVAPAYRERIPEAERESLERAFRLRLRASATPEQLSLHRPVDHRLVDVVAEGGRLVVHWTDRRCVHAPGRTRDCEALDEVVEGLGRGARVRDQQKGIARVEILAPGAMLPVEGIRYLYYDLSTKQQLGELREPEQVEDGFQRTHALPSWRVYEDAVVEKRARSLRLIHDGQERVIHELQEGELRSFEVEAPGVALVTQHDGDRLVVVAVDLDSGRELFREQAGEPDPGDLVRSFGAREREILRRARERLAAEQSSEDDGNGASAKRTGEASPLDPPKVGVTIQSAGLTPSQLVYEVAIEPEADREPAPEHRVFVLSLEGDEQPQSLRRARLAAAPSRHHELLTIATPDGEALYDATSLAIHRAPAPGSVRALADGSTFVRLTNDALLVEASGREARVELEEGQTDIDFGTSRGGALAGLLSSEGGHWGFFRQDARTRYRVDVYDGGDVDGPRSVEVRRIRGELRQTHPRPVALLDEGRHLLARGRPSQTREGARREARARAFSQVGNPAVVLDSLAMDQVDCAPKSQHGPYVLAADGHIVRAFGGGRFEGADGDRIYALRRDGICIWNWRTGVVEDAIPLLGPDARDAVALQVHGDVALVAMRQELLVVRRGRGGERYRLRLRDEGTSVVVRGDGDYEVRGEAGEMLCAVGPHLVHPRICAGRRRGGLLAPLALGR